MDTDTDLFVQAFWVKCRETIRPEIDLAVGRLRDAGHDAHVATLEYAGDAPGSPEGAPALVVTVHPKGDAEAAILRYRGDVASRDVETTSSVQRASRHYLDAIDTALVKTQLAETFGTLADLD